MEIKTILTLILTAAIAAMSSGIAFADNQKLENRLIRQQQKAAEKAAHETIALSGTKSSTDRTSDLQTELLYSGHGQTSVVYVPKF